MPTLRNPRHERFVQLLASGKNATMLKGFSAEQCQGIYQYFTDRRRAPVRDAELLFLLRRFLVPGAALKTYRRHEPAPNRV
jgi:hypothetical protein